MLETPPLWMNKKNSAKKTEQNFLHSNAMHMTECCSAAKGGTTSY